MTEADYILVSNLIRLRHAQDLLSMTTFESQNSLSKKLEAHIAISYLVRACELQIQEAMKIE